jgi:O-antigen/teichoic acid export membrane protein
LSPELSDIALTAFAFAIPMAALAVFQSWFQGAILYGRRTRAIPESTAIFVAVFAVIAAIGIARANWVGIYVGIWGFVIATLLQTAWLWLRSRKALADVKRRDLYETG